MYYIIITAVVILTFTLTFRYYTSTKKSYNDNVKIGYERMTNSVSKTITEDDLVNIPELVQDYLRYVGVVDKKIPNSFTAKVDGQMRMDRQKDWADVTVNQVTFLNNDTRLFYIVMKMFGIPINGLHHYENANARMVIKILDLFKIIDNKGEIMNIAETVTYFNDMCIFSPAKLVDANIKWETTGDLSVLATYTTNGITISAELFFNENKQLINFVSNDRYASYKEGEYERLPWSTPISDYKEFNGYMLASKGEAIWHYEDEDFAYIRLDVKDVIYD